MVSRHVFGRRRGNACCSEALLWCGRGVEVESAQELGRLVNRRKGSSWRGWVRLGAVLLLAAAIAGCGAAYARSMKGPLKRLQFRDYEGALGKLEKPLGNTNKLLYRLERGLIHHYQGGFQESNRQFDKAERLAERLETRSVSREVAALLTNDAIRPYRGEELERALIHYYRALNYRYLQDPQGALVECRKANIMLAAAAAKAEYELSYRNDAFIQYMTGLFFEAEEEWNDAYISYKDALKGYAAYETAFGMSMPPVLARDLVQLAQRLGYDDDVTEYSERYGVEPPPPGVAEDCEVTIFAESGFIARKSQKEIQVPILEDDDTGNIWRLSDHMVHRYHHPRTYEKVKHWLKVALPEYRPSSPKVHGVRLSSGGQTASASLAEDLNAIAFKNFSEKESTILLRTAARALAKYTMTEVAEDKNEVLGWLANLFGTATEAADTRGWLTLPGEGKGRGGAPFPRPASAARRACLPQLQMFPVISNASARIVDFGVGD